MGSVISKTANANGIYRFIENVNPLSFSEDDWLRNPDVTGVAGIQQMFWKYNGTIAVAEMSTNEKTVARSSTEELGSEHDSILFAQRGDSANRWLRVGAGMFQPSNRQPFIVMRPGIITAIDFSNHVDGVDANIHVYINKVRVYDWELRNKRYAYKTNALSHLSFKEGDRLAVLCKQVGKSNPTYVMVNIQYRYTLQVNAEGGAASI